MAISFYYIPLFMMSVVYFNSASSENFTLYDHFHSVGNSLGRLEPK